LPTDPRFRELGADQKELLFMSFLMLPSDEDYRKGYASKHRAPNVPDEILEKMGYDIKEIEEVKKELAGG